MDQFWDQNAEAWFKVIESNGIPSRRVTNEAILQELLLLRPKSVLDLGCGEGFMARPLLQNGIAYRGLDGSQELIRLAQQKYGDHFESVSYEQLPQWKCEQKLDVVLFNFSLFEEDLVPLFRTVRDLLAPMGSVVIQTLHFCFAMKEYRSGWNIEDFKTMSVPFSGTMRWYGRTLSDWQKIFTESDLSIRKITEPNYEGKPASLIFELRKSEDLLRKV